MCALFNRNRRRSFSCSSKTRNVPVHKKHEHDAKGSEKWITCANVRNDMTNFWSAIQFSINLCIKSCVRLSEYRLNMNCEGEIFMLFVHTMIDFAYKPAHVTWQIATRISEFERAMVSNERKTRRSSFGNRSKQLGDVRLFCESVRQFQRIMMFEHALKFHIASYSLAATALGGAFS